MAAFVYPGHPLLDAVIILVREQNNHLMKQGAVLVDDTDETSEVTSLFLLEHSVQDGRVKSSSKPNIISQKLQFAAIGKAGDVTNAGMAPHLNLRPATDDEIKAVEGELSADWLRSDLEKKVTQFATVELARAHVSEVRARRVPEIDKVEQEVKARLKKEINHWDSRAFELKEEEKAGKKTRLNWQNAQRRAEDLAERLKRRLEIIEQERFISAQPPRVRGGMIIVPIGLLRERMPDQFRDVGSSLYVDPLARKEIEVKAINAVMALERELGNVPISVENQRGLGYDIESFDPQTGHLRCLEVKGRVDTADTIMITRNELMASLNKEANFFLVFVSISNGFAQKPTYRPGRLMTREPEFGQTAIQFSIKSLLEQAETPT